MLYLAEVQRKTRVIGGGRAELKLLACQRNEQSWVAVPGEEIIPAPDDATYNAGALVMVELSASRQVQRHTEAGRQLVSILQNFSRLQDKFKTQEEEIEQWKQSLTYQSQELNRREMEMEARQEQLQQMEEDFERLDQQRQEIEGSREEVNRLKEEFERKNQELEGAWAHLRGEMSRFEEHQSVANQSSSLDEAKAYQMQELLGRLSGVVTPTEVVREQINASFDIMSQQQGATDHYQQTLEQHRLSAQQLQEAVDQMVQHVQSHWQEWQTAQATLEQSKSDLAAQQKALETKQEYAEALTRQLQRIDTLYQQATQLSDGTGVAVKIDLGALEIMSLEDLQSTVRDLEKELEKNSRFVQSQEEELALQQDTINQLRQRMEQASEYDRLQLSTELSDEQESYRMLNETLVGQRRNLQERQAVLKQHKNVLARRQGLPMESSDGPTVDISPLLNQLDTQRQEIAQALQAIQSQIQELCSAVEHTQNRVNQQAGEQESRWHTLKQLEEDLQTQRASAGELWGKVNAFQETLQLAQESTGGLRDRLETIAGLMAQFQEASDHQMQAIAELRQLIISLTEPAAEYAA